MSEANTIWIQLYTPGGAKLGVTLGFADGKFTETLPDVALIDAMIAEKGYLVTQPGLEPGEDAIEIGYVCRYIKFDEKNNRDVSHVAFYATHDGLVNRWVHHYMDTSDDIAAFENATGLVLDKIPAWDGDTHPAKNAPKAIRAGAIVKLAKPIRIARETYTNKDGEPRHKLKRYVDTIGSSKPAPTQPSTPASGNAGNGASGKQSVDANKMQAPDENTWKRWVFEATKFLYTVDGNYNDHQQRESLKKRMADTDKYGIDSTMTLYEVLSRLIRYRALHDLFIDTGDYQNIFAMSFEDYYEKHGALPTWQRMNEYYIANTRPAKTKAS